MALMDSGSAWFSVKRVRDTQCSALVALLRFDLIDEDELAVALSTFNHAELRGLTGGGHNTTDLCFAIGR